MKPLLLITMMLVGMAMAACGPQEPSDQKDDQQISQLISKEEAKYAPIAGSYVGNLTRADGVKEQVQLLLIPERQPSLNTSRFGTTPVPTVGGYFSFCVVDGAKCFTDKKLKSDKSTSIPVGQFNQATYDPKTQRIYITSSVAVTTAGSASSSGATTGNGAAQFYIDAIANGGEIKGNFWTTDDMTPKPIDLKRTK